MAQDDAALRAELKAFSRSRPRWGYRQAHQHLLEQGWSINRKRTQRLWREEGLRVPAKRRKRRRRGESTVPGDRLRAERPDHVWAFDFQFDVTDDGRAVKLLHVVDEFTREALAMEAERSIDADRVVDVLERLVRQRGRPEFVRCDNGPEMTSVALKDWCRFSRTGAAFIEPGSPWENPFVESFNSRVRDELLSGEVFSCLAEAKVMVEDFRQDYNRCRPHRAHAMMTPAAFRQDGRPPTRRRAPAPNCTRPPGSLRSTLARTLTWHYLPTTSSHSRWTNERGPVTLTTAGALAGPTGGCGHVRKQWRIPSRLCGLTGAQLPRYRAEPRLTPRDMLRVASPVSHGSTSRSIITFCL